MADKKTRADLEILFSSGKIPTQSNFADLIASGVSQKDDGLQKAGDTPLKIQAPVTVETDGKAPKDLILFYENIESADAKWRIGSRSDSLEINRVGQNDFLIDANGNVGIGADKPGAKLHVAGKGLFASSGGSDFGTVNLGDANHGIKSTAGDGVTLFSYQVPAGIHLKQTTGNVGIGTTAPAGRLNVFEDTGTVAGASQGTVVIDHENSGGASSLVFRSKVNRGNDYGYIQYQDAATVGSAGESARLIIGVENDADDHLILKPTGNVGIGTNDPKGKLHIFSNGGFGGENADGQALPGNVPIVAQSNGTAFGLLNANSRPALAVNIEGDGGTKSIRGVITFYDKYDGNWHQSLALKNGSVGIGTISPLGPLSVGDSSVDGSDGYLVIGKRRGGGTRHHRIGYDEAWNFVIGDYGYSNTAGTWVSQFAISFAAPAKSFYINQEGKTGIGTNAPVGRLNVSEDSGSIAGISQGTIVLDHENNGGASSIVFRSKVNRTSDFGYIQYQDTAAVGGGGESARLIIGIENDADDHLILLPSGNVGIGTSDPKARLDVRGSRVVALNDSPDGFGPNTGFTNWGDRGGNFNLSILADNWIGAAGFVANSDRRIKEIVGLSDTAQDLEIIEKMCVTDYRPLDKMAEGNFLRRGFIAQEVLDVFPQAVGKRTNVIPDIYSDAASFVFDSAQKTLSVTLPKAHALSKGQTVQILTEDASKTATVVAVPTSDSFVVDGFEKAPQRVFVYGRQVDDFLSVHYDQIFSTGIGAIQELNKIVASKSALITSLENELSDLKHRVAALETQTDNGSRAASIGER